jgi:MFS family permease
MLFPGSMFLGTGLGTMNLINVTRTSSINGKKGKVAGVFSFFTVAGMITGPILGGFIGGVLGLQTVFLLLVPVFFVLGIRVYNRTEKHGSERT